MTRDDILKAFPQVGKSTYPGDGFTCDLPGGFSVRVKVEHDDCTGEPWKEHDGHGPVSDWRAKDSKAPSELVLYEDGGRARFYDFAEACKIARRDGWGFTGQYVYEDGKKPRMTDEARAMTPKARAARAAMDDFKRLRAWCNDDWTWIYVSVRVVAPDGAQATDSVGGIESDSDYWREVAADCTDVCLSELSEKVRRAEMARCFC